MGNRIEDIPGLADALKAFHKKHNMSANWHHDLHADPELFKEYLGLFDYYKGRALLASYAAHPNKPAFLCGVVKEPESSAITSQQLRADIKADWNSVPEYGLSVEQFRELYDLLSEEREAVEFFYAPKP